MLSANSVQQKNMTVKANKRDESQTICRWLIAGGQEAPAVTGKRKIVRERIVMCVLKKGVRK